MDVQSVVKELRNAGDHAAVEGLKRYRITGKVMLGVAVPELRKLAKRIGKSHQLALDLWDTGIHEARILASMVDEPERVTRKQMEKWAGEFDSWDVCDGCCGNLFVKTPFAYEKAMKWSRAEGEFVKRAGFAMMAELAVHDGSSADSRLIRFFPAIKAGSTDRRNFVKKAVNWALRQIGKRDRSLNKKAIQVGEEIRRLDSRSARWIAADALRELKSPGARKKFLAS